MAEAEPTDESTQDPPAIPTPKKIDSVRSVNFSGNVSVIPSSDVEEGELKVKGSGDDGTDMDHLMKLMESRAKRLSLATNITRYQQATVRSERSSAPQSRSSRISRYLLRCFSIQNKKEKGEDEDNEHVSAHGNFVVSSRDQDHQGPQYRLQAVSSHEHLPLWKRLTIMFSIYERDIHSQSYCSPNRVLMRYLNWSFRHSFAEVFASAAIGFMFWTFFFAVPIFLLGRRHPTCLGGVSTDDENYDGHPAGTFIDAYMLSWTTFSTVGYGLVYSGLSTEEEDILLCTGITIVCSLESFMGVLFSSICLAIIFAKVTRTQSFAQVKFSDPIVVRYGPGVSIESTNSDEQGEDDSDESGEDKDTKIPCPVLEFRINNRLHSTLRGEIIDGSVNIVASIDADQAMRSISDNPMKRRRGKRGHRRGRRASMMKRRSRRSVLLSADQDSSDESGSDSSSDDKGLDISQLTEVQEDPSGKLAPRRVFAKIFVETPEHPFFRRVWIVRHRLNEESPLLKAPARHLVKSNSGFWPKELCSAESIRNSFHFHKFLVHLTGTSNADANSVYAQQTYDFSDVCVGYRFVNQLYRDEQDGTLRMDPNLINDIMEQAGGGSEKLSFKAGVDHSANSMWVL